MRAVRGCPCSSASAVAGCTLAFLLSVSVMPVYRKMLFTGRFPGVEEFPYPCTAASIQLSVAAALLFSCNVGAYLLAERRRARRSGEASMSWLFGPHFLYKLAKIAPTGVLYGMQYVVMSWGILLIDNSTHLLIAGTELIWFVLLAFIINKEVPTLAESGAILFCIIADGIVISVALKDIKDPVLPILVNLLGPFLAAVCIAYLREAVKAVSDPSNPLQGNMSKIEFTGFKLAVAGLIAFISAFVLESGIEGKLGLSWRRIVHDYLGTPEQAWWSALSEYSSLGVLLIAASGLIIFSIHLNITWLTALTSTTAVGILQKAKLIPQWLLNQLFQIEQHLDRMQVVGAVATLVGCALYVMAASIKRVPGRVVLASPVELPQQRQFFEVDIEGPAQLRRPLG